MSRAIWPLSVAREQILSGSLKRHDGDIARHGINLRPGIDDEPTRRPQILASMMKTALEQRHSWRFAQAFSHARCDTTVNHPSIIGNQFPICMVIFLKEFREWRPGSRFTLLSWRLPPCNVPTTAA
ncbi:hypothetical protein [Sphingobium sp.]|uniref:hypothetical protein n=1 Tax=Sphingobium sp. TaxID=1912891 RepID=UPI0025811121|nr:hypothetical protein [Sphingobium sp.]